MSGHYTAVIKIIKIIDPEDKVDTRKYSNPPKPTAKKDSELASLVVRAPSLETLLSQVTSHLSHINDF